MHRDTLDRALNAIRERTYWSAYPESPKAYGEDGETVGRPTGKAAFDGYLGSRSRSTSPAPTAGAAARSRPYGIELGVTYPHADVDALLAAATAGDAGLARRRPARRAPAVCLEILARINARTHEFAHAVMHTSGQAFMMAFQAGGPHAQDRALEAVAYAYAEMTRTPRQARLGEAAGQARRRCGDQDLHRRAARHRAGHRLQHLPDLELLPGPVRLPGHRQRRSSSSRTRARCCRSRSPSRSRARCWPRPASTPNLVALAAERPGEGIAKTLAARPEIRIIDYTGSTAFGDWLEANARQAQVYTEKAGVNTVVIDSTDDYAGMLSQPGVLPVPLQRPDVHHPAEPADPPRRHHHRRRATRASTRSAPTSPRRSAGCSATTRGRSRCSARSSTTACWTGSRRPRRSARSCWPRGRSTHPDFPDAVGPYAADRQGRRRPTATTYLQRVVRAGLVRRRHRLDRRSAASCSARPSARRARMTAAVYSTDETVLDAVEEAALDEGVAAVVNLTGGVYVNQTAAFSDFHGSGGNPAANAALTDGAYVANRFRVVQSRDRHAGRAPGVDLFCHVSGLTVRQPTAATDRTRRPDETEDEQADRRYQELLQELRVAEPACSSFLPSC